MDRDAETTTLEAKPEAQQERGFVAPLSITRDELLIEGRDDRFRELIYALFVTAARFDNVREAFGREIGVTGAQYFILIATAHQQGRAGVGIRTLADYLHVAASHVTTEVRKLVNRGLLSKRVNPNDGRGVLVSLTPAGEAALETLAPFRQAINNILFRDIGREDFLVLARFLDGFVDSTEEALRRIADHERKRERQRTARPGDRVRAERIGGR